MVRLGRMTPLHLARKWCADAERIVALTGAGISVASGLPTLRTRMGERSLRDLFRLDLAERHVAEYRHFYAGMMRSWSKARPNAAHEVLAKSGALIITQNVDGLHQRAGSRDVIELHGALHRIRCTGCRSLYPLNACASRQAFCAACGGLLWPDLVLEGQAVHGLLQAQNWISTADVLLVVGTTLTMDPVRRLPLAAEGSGTRVLVVNRDAERSLPQLLCPE